ncbi:MAG TPA: DUF2938 family protein [Gemmatimonadaceae bacterium]|nr:DUF2938 family protein [Gemmatimonadaceae bacterium]
MIAPALVWPRLAEGLAIGAAATAGIDAWNALLARTLGVRSLDYCLLGRWVRHLPGGVIRHRSIADAAPRTHECAAGWAAHYGIGASLAAAFVLVVAPGWLGHPTLAPALAYGIVTVVFPFFVLQPAIGLGVASAAARRPAQARLKSLATHTVYGLGLYAAARMVAWLAR